MTTWEYLTIPLIVHNTKAILDNYGSEGWDLVQVVQGPPPSTRPDGSGAPAAGQGPGNLVAYLKRPKQA